MSRLRIGIIGAGGIAESTHVPSYKAFPELCEVVAFCEPDAERRVAFAEKFGIANAYSDHREMFDAEKLDAVSVTTPNAFHHQPVLDSFKAGMHVLCEKPLAMNGPQAREMCLAAKHAKKILQVGFQLRFNSPARFVKQFVDSGQLGTVQYARAQALRRRGVPGWGVFIDKEKQGGGPLIDIGVHILDLTLHLMGYPKPVSVSGQTWNTLGKRPGLSNWMGDYDRSKFTVEDFAVGFIRFANGSVVTLESAFMSNGEGDPFLTQLYGTDAGVIMRNSGDEPVRIFKEIEGQYFNMVPPRLPSITTPPQEQIGAFLMAITENKPSPVPGENGFVLNAIFDALYASAASGKEEPVEADL